MGRGEEALYWNKRVTIVRISRGKGVRGFRKPLVFTKENALIDSRNAVYLQIKYIYYPY